MTIAACPVCAGLACVRLAPDWQAAVDAGGTIPVVGCGNPWHYVMDDDHMRRRLGASEGAPSGQRVSGTGGEVSPPRNGPKPDGVDAAMANATEVLALAALSWSELVERITAPRGPLVAEAQRAAWSVHTAARAYRQWERLSQVAAVVGDDAKAPCVRDER